MGLKSASFSQAARLTVSTWCSGGADHVRTWDLEVVTRTGEWRLQRGVDTRTQEILRRLRPEGCSGTIVVWTGLHRFPHPTSAEDTAAQKQFYAEVERVEAHLGMVFARFLTGRRGLRLSVNDTPVQPWDPFLTHHPSVRRLPVEEIPVGGHLIRVEAFILPHPRRLEPDERARAAGPRGWLDQQGFYLYRRNRLILAGQWLGLRGLRRDERYNLARIAVEVPVEADGEWAVDVRKSSAVPPVGVRRHLLRHGMAARSGAAEVLSHRGRVAAREHGAEFIHAWRLDRRDGHVRCRINRDHPLVREVLQGGGETVADTRALIRLLEETVPVAALRILSEDDVADDPEPFLGAPSEEVTAVARRIYGALVNQGHTPNEARQRVALMPPFDRVEGFWTTPR
jgi:hypothetical protein